MAYTLKKDRNCTNCFYVHVNGIDAPPCNTCETFSNWKKPDERQLTGYNSYEKHLKSKGDKHNG
jgi:hypothetical protein